MLNSLYPILFLLALSVSFPAAPAFSSDAEVSGEILDMACYLGRNAKGPAHARCAQTCAEHGMPLGVLTEDDKVYLLYPKHGKEEAFDDVKKFAGKKAKLSGIVHDRHGMLGFEVHEVSKPD